MEGNGLGRWGKEEAYPQALISLIVLYIWLCEKGGLCKISKLFNYHRNQKFIMLESFSKFWSKTIRPLI